MYSSRDVDCFSRIFNIESYLRLLVRWELKGGHGSSWKGIIPTNIKNEVNLRKNQEQKIGCVDVVSSNMLSYLNLSELKDVLILPTLWKNLKSHWSARNIVLADFQKLMAVRNKVAHFRPITKNDIRHVHRFQEDLNYNTVNMELYRRRSKKITEDNFNQPEGVFF